MISSLNDKIRDSILNNSLLDIIIGLEGVEENTKDKILRLLLSDHYKISLYEFLYFKNDTDLLLFENSIDGILFECKDNYKTLSSIVTSSIKFNSLDFIGKIIIMNEMKKYDANEYLSKINPFHLLDMLIYQINYDLDSFKEYYLDYLEKNKNSPKRREFAGNYISRRIEDLIKIDLVKYKKYIVECIKEYYKWKLFIKNHDGENLLFDEDYEYLNKIEEYSIDDLLKLSMNDYKFLTTIVGEYLHYTTSKVEINESIIDNYLISNTDIKLKEKLKIKGEF